MKLSNKIKVLIVFIFVSSIFIYFFYQEGTLPMEKNNKTAKIFVIRKGETLTEIANNLSKEGLIRNKLIFYLIVKRMNIDKKIQAGDFRLSPAMDVYQIAKNLTHGTLDIWLTIIEGLRKEELAQIVAQKLYLPEIEFLKYAQEGYLFPDTYLIPRDATIGAVLKILTSNFEKKYSMALKEKPGKRNLTDKEVVILASLIEKEAKYDQDRQIVADIIYKRYKNGWSLQIDAAIQYLLGYQPEEKTWWKKNISKEDKEIDSPYNIYKNKGFPPTPICNPGLASIKAAMNANDLTPYWYYLSDKTGRMHYAKTLEEHNENIRKYIQ